MQSASHRGLLDIEYLPTRREKMWERAREWMGGGRLVAGILVLLLAEQGWREDECGDQGREEITSGGESGFGVGMGWVA